MGRTTLTCFFIAVCALCLPAHAKSHHIDGDSWFGCVSKDYYSTLVGYVTDNDKEALKKALLAGLATGQCNKFKADEEVFLEDTSVIPGLVQVRPKGETIEYWTNMEAIKSDSQQGSQLDHPKESQPSAVSNFVWVALGTLAVLVIGVSVFNAVDPRQQQKRQEKSEAALAARIGVEKVGDEYRLKK
jgi:hypothetical protein